MWKVKTMSHASRRFLHRAGRGRWANQETEEWRGGDQRCKKRTQSVQVYENH